MPHFVFKQNEINPETRRFGAVKVRPATFEALAPPPEDPRLSQLLFNLLLRGFFELFPYSGHSRPWD